ncbi:DUF3558 domain-containing protein [Nocardia brasiliensis]|uniref:DUF3558 domain-containing protein n=1 Tax=Nocardia brasiliensis TaxID=37326 RepID=A0A6G9XNN8_NOCBR|nr:DUF3558 domain-containing protein [Nocardia brasiliensis]QIS02518.1 DUF3558 domain-containing protein [Nocardia brasiliensis]
MTRRSKSWTVGILALGAVLVAGGCGPSEDGPGKTSDPSTAQTSLSPDVPAGFDPCKDIPQSVLDSEKLRNRGEANSSANGGIKWRGCRYGRTDGYFVSIRTTNITVEMTREKNFPETTEFTASGREAISTRQFDGPYIKEACTVNVEMKHGSLDFDVSNPPSNRETGSTDACQLARTLAEKVASAIPAGA